MNNKLLNLSLIVLLAALSVYVVVRAHNLSFTHDESLSYTIIKGSPQWATSPNNHSLNTWLMEFCSHKFGNRELFLRLPNVLAFVVYAVFVFLLLRRPKNAALGLFGAFLLLLNPFLIDFFSLARGYGLSLGFIAASLWFLLRKDLNQHSGTTFVGDMLGGVFFATLVILANLSAINFYIAILCIFVVQYGILAFWYKKTKIWHHVAFLAVLALAYEPFMWSVAKLLQLSSEDQLYFGERTLGGSLTSLIKSSFYLSAYPGWVAGLAKYLTFALLTAAAAGALFQRFLHRRLQKIMAVIVLIVAGLVVEHHLFKANYPAERTALLFIPLLGLAFYEGANYGYAKMRTDRKPVIAAVLAGVTGLALAGHFAANCSVKYTLTWHYDAHTKDVMKIIGRANWARREGEPKISISNGAIFEPALNYYRETMGLTQVWPATRDPLNGQAEFIYEFETHPVFTPDMERVAEFKDIKTILCKGKPATE